MNAGKLIKDTMSCGSERIEDRRGAAFTLSLASASNLVTAAQNQSFRLV